MTKEEKQILLVDLCSRLSYGVRVQCLQGTELRYDGYKIHGLSEDGSYLSLFSVDIPHGVCNLDLEVCEIRPYLRPMESMTEEEREEWFKQSHVEYDCEFHTEPTLSLCNCHLSTDWLNKKMFDYRGLIPMGLALEAPEGMYNNI